jgi:uncharacterized protein YutD
MRLLTRARCVGIVLASLTASLLYAQTPPARTAEQIEASFKAHQNEFDYLLGDWEFTATSQEFGKLRGFWSAVRLVEGQILDEYRIVGDKGETFYVTTTIRAYNAVLDRWELIGMDEGNGLNDVGTAQRAGSEMHIEQRFGVMSRNPTIRKIRYYDIRPDRFSWTSDLTRDDGKTWIKNELQIEARRIGPARHLGPLASSKR